MLFGNASISYVIFLFSILVYLQPICSALAGLPDGLREKLIKTEEQRAGFQDLYESVCCLSTTDSLRLFNDNITDKTSDHLGLQNYFADLRSLLLDSPGIKVQLP